MQLMIEYLLYCQEAQFGVIQELTHRNDGLDGGTTELQKKVVSLMEDVKIYKRQLSVLRRSLEQAHEALRDPKLAASLPSRVTYDPGTGTGAGTGSPTSPVDQTGGAAMDRLAPIVDSVLKVSRIIGRLHA
jgi:hypothetical protein